MSACDGKIGGDADGKWYGGVYGWGFSPIVPHDRQARRPQPRAVVLRRLHERLSAVQGRRQVSGCVAQDRPTRSTPQAKVVDGKKSAPTMYGDQGWYSFKPGKYNLQLPGNLCPVHEAVGPRPLRGDRLVRLSWKARIPAIRSRRCATAWRASASQMEIVDADTTSADMRLADAALDFNPGLDHGPDPVDGRRALSAAWPGWARTSPGQGGTLLFSRLRYFDPERRRAGLPQDVAALVDSWSADSLTVTFVNISPSAARSVIVQGGAYGEHQIVSVSRRQGPRQRECAQFPACGWRRARARKLTIRMKRFANDPTLSFPWEATVADLGNPPDIAQYVHKSSGVP